MHKWPGGWGVIQPCYHKRSALCNDPATLFEQGKPFSGRKLCQKNHCCPHSCVDRFVGEQKLTQQRIETRASLIGQRVDKSLPARSARSSFSLYAQIALFGETVEQVIQVRFLQVGIQLAMGPHDAV